MEGKLLEIWIKMTSTPEGFPFFQKDTPYLYDLYTFCKEGNARYSILSCSRLSTYINYDQMLFQSIWQSFIILHPRDTTGGLKVNLSDFFHLKIDIKARKKLHSLRQLFI